MICAFCGKEDQWPANDGFSRCSICNAPCHDFQDGGGYCMTEHRKTHLVNLNPFTFNVVPPSERVVEPPLSYEAAWQRLTNIINDTDIHSISIERLKALMLECLTNANNPPVR